MVIDTLENLEKYVSLNPLFKEVVDFIKANDLNSLEIGKHEINGADLFVNVQMAKGKTKEAAVLETHKKMIDIQIPLVGKRRMDIRRCAAFLMRNTTRLRILPSMKVWPIHM